MTHTDETADLSDRVSLINETRSRLAQVSASRTPKTRGRRRRSVPSLLTLSLTSPHQSTSSWSVRETDLSPALSPSQDIPDGHPYKGTTDQGTKLAAWGGDR